MPLRTNMTGRARSTGAIVVHIAFLLALLAASSAEAADELYRSRFVVTGQSVAVLIVTAVLPSADVGCAELTSPAATVTEVGSRLLPAPAGTA